ncbi:hypothetical protein [Luteitalea sp.]|uniref:hypothetical protein n=1 Tax=Luteitalea sp. TaxID=2004800 RepID=UPI0025C09C77|nr:hypothetical protein [Luteitalea sp.]
MRILPMLAVLLSASCVGVTAQRPVELLATPAGAGSGMYALATGADGRTYLTWLEPVTGGGHALKFSRLDAGAWAPPRQIAQGANWFVNWADHPSLTATRDGRLFVHWLVNTGQKAGAYGYAIRAQSSADGGQTWQTVFEEGTQNVSDYSGFLSFLPTGAGMSAVYLTPLAPDTAATHAAHGGGHAEGHVKTVGIASFAPDGRELARTIVDRDACSCCSTDMADTADGPVAVYRDHEPGEIRDIAIVRRVNGTWTAPTPVHRDGWMIPGCPTNGPAVAAAGKTVVVAWFTAAGGTAKVLAAFSDDAGATFAAPIRVDDGDPVGWAGVTMLDGSRPIVSWLERKGGGGEVRLREVSATSRSEALTVAATSNGRATGIPMIARAGDDLIVAWRDGQVKTARVPWPTPRPRP